jgi:hypothetical protein
MARVVGVHGAFHELWGPHQIAGRWIPALRDGLALAGADVATDQVAMAFYGDLFRPDPATPLDDDALREVARRTGILDAATELVGADGLDVLVEHVGREQVRRWRPLSDRTRRSSWPTRWAPSSPTRCW